MRRRRSGHVINLSSIGGYEAYPIGGVYGATKFAVEGLSEAMAQELQPLGIRVTVAEPGFFRADFLDSTSLSKTAREIEKMDISPLLQRLEGNLCQSPHWGYALAGKVVTTYADGDGWRKTPNLSCSATRGSAEDLPPVFV